MSAGAAAYILRLNSEEAERKLFMQKWLYVGLSRGWNRGSEILFTRRSESFIGYGSVERVQQTEELDTTERELCLQKNWSAKIHFDSLTRFHPPVLVADTPLASQNALTLHGLQVNPDAVSAIADLATCRIIF